MRFWSPIVAMTAVICFAIPMSTGMGSAEAGTSVESGFAGPARGIQPASSLAPVNGNSSQQFTSRNWDGYVTYSSTAGTDFNKVRATWIQPVVRCEVAQAWTVFWIGLDGWYDGTVEQGGSSAYCPSAGATPEYDIWWEMYPTNSIQTVLTIKPGDHITASVTYSTTSSRFAIFVADTTTKKSFSRSELCASDLVCERSSADFITEDVGRSGAGSYFPLADYGTMSYNNASAVDTSGKSGSISSDAWLNAAVTEKSGSTTYAKVSPLRDSGTSFSTTWAHR